jgi:hypothetical protein
MRKDVLAVGSGFEPDRPVFPCANQIFVATGTTYPFSLCSPQLPHTPKIEAGKKPASSYLNSRL